MINNSQIQGKYKVPVVTEQSCEMVTIKASYRVIPNEPTPNGPLWLSESDQMVRWTHAATLYIYKANHKDDAIERMRDSLSMILVHYYPIAGRLRWIQGGRLELDCNAKGVVLMESESTKRMAEYGDFSPKEPIEDLIPTFDYTQPIEEIPLLVVQVTRLYDKGVAIGVALSHSLADGFANVCFINTWAKLVRGDTLDMDEMFPTLDRSIMLKSSYPSFAPRFDHPEMYPLPLMLGKSDCMEEKNKSLTVATLKLTSQQVEKLKKMANDQTQRKGSRPYSKYEAIVAYIWRCACKARQLDDTQPTQVRFLVDIRNKLNPPLPQNYFGNAVARTVSPMCNVGELISSPLSYASQKIRESIEILTNEYIRSQQDFIRGQEHLDWIRASYIRPKEDRNAPFDGNPNLGVVSWMSMPWQKADFGWGKPMHFGPGHMWPSDIGVIIGGPNGDGSIIISMHFQVAHMQLFTKFFWQDMLDSSL
ncbi:spermidine hydroxycinnamoyl transferase-like [Abrus precatorius]|uniref:Spermidine hydroxycinnamoyl transferase-like n=1 Tax=Abrus precatorius TaxID=3816 RepID=A0A8B8KJ46_ABRPR|nr:spermidine hydroxycinnamoyl transferase-like [Abrus precatorius]